MGKLRSLRSVKAFCSLIEWWLFMSNEVSQFLCQLLNSTRDLHNAFLNAMVCFFFLNKQLNTTKSG